MNRNMVSVLLVSLGFMLGIMFTILSGEQGYLNYHGSVQLREGDTLDEGDDVLKKHDVLATDTPGKPVNLTEKDKLVHEDDDTEARRLFEKVKVLCWVMTSEQNLPKKAVHVNATWARRCNKVLYMSDKNNTKFPAIAVDAPAGYGHLTARTMKVFQYLHDNHLEDADWFMKSDDDTYVILENLRYMLSNHSSEKKIFFGHVFNIHVKQGYASGGGGYVVSKGALRVFGNRADELCSKDNGAEDLEFGRCMEKLNVKLGDSRDILGRSRFHCFTPQTFIHGGYPDWYFKYDKYGAKKGAAHMSDYPISFHYVSPDNMYNMEYFVYHMRPYGIHSKAQNLNR